MNAQSQMTIGELTSHIGSGATPRGGAQAYRDSGVPFIRSQNVRDGRLDLTTIAFITDATHASMSRSAVRPGDVLLNITGASIGRSCVVPGSLLEANVNQHVCILRSNGKVFPAYLHAMLEQPETQHSLREIAAGGSREGLNYQQVASLNIPWFPLAEQLSIAKLYDSFHRTQSALNALATGKRAVKRALLHELLTGRLRFPEFRGSSFRLAALGEIATAGAARNRGMLDQSRVMGVLKDAGMVPMRDHVRADDLTRYQIVSPDGFAYNPMRLNIGSIARNLSGADCLVSPDYVVFTTDSSALLPAYLDQVRRSHIWSDFVRPAGSGSVRVRIYFRDLAEMLIPLPTLPEQRRIVETLEAADREIALLEQLRDGNQFEKRALMQLLLSGDLPLPAATAGPEVAHA